MPSKKLNYEKIIKDMWQKNARQVPNLVRKGEKNTLKQIGTYSNCFDISESTVKDKILIDALFANCFSKNPTRQSPHEKIALNYLKQYGNNILNSLRKLPQSGKNAVYLTDNGIFQKYSITRKKIGKALDFYWEADGKKFYASHKYTKNSGGAQDSQYAEQTQLLRKFKENTSCNEYLFVICDGDFYTKEKMHALDDLTSKRSFALCIEDVVDTVKEIINIK